MKQEFQVLYKEMLQDIKKNMSLSLPELERVEFCFRITSEYWGLLKKKIAESPFKDEEDEICFFKKTKPRFTGYIQYFIILSEALLFVPQEEQTALIYWEAEMQRFKRFYDKHAEFFLYYEEGGSSLDRQYFLRKNNNMSNVNDAPVYDIDMEFYTSHDGLLRSLRAHGMYHGYVINRLRKLNSYLQIS
jgi:hypothetical protein